MGQGQGQGGLPGRSANWVVGHAGSSVSGVHQIHLAGDPRVAPNPRPTYPSINEVLAASAPPELPKIEVCHFRGHQLDGDVVRYADGLLAGNCKDCGDRVTIGAIPAGPHLVRAQWLLDQVLGDTGDPAKLALELRDLVVEVQTELEAFAQARRTLELAKQIVAQKLVKGL